MHEKWPSKTHEEIPLIANANAKTIVFERQQLKLIFASCKMHRSNEKPFDCVLFLSYSVDLWFHFVAKTTTSDRRSTQKQKTTKQKNRRKNWKVEMQKKQFECVNNVDDEQKQTKQRRRKTNRVNVSTLYNNNHRNYDNTRNGVASK